MSDDPSTIGVGHCINTYQKCPKCGGTNFEAGWPTPFRAFCEEWEV